MLAVSGPSSSSASESNRTAESHSCRRERFAPARRPNSRVTAELHPKPINVGKSSRSRPWPSRVSDDAQYFGRHAPGAVTPACVGAEPCAQSVHVESFEETVSRRRAAFESVGGSLSTAPVRPTENEPITSRRRTTVHVTEPAVVTPDRSCRPLPSPAKTPASYSSDRPISPEAIPPMSRLGAIDPANAARSRKLSDAAERAVPSRPPGGLNCPPRNLSSAAHSGTARRHP